MNVVVMFQKRFVPFVESGSKRYTIRRVRKGRQVQAGDLLRLRFWSGPAYRSPQTEIADRVCLRTSSIEIHEVPEPMILVDGVRLDPDQVAAMAKIDGFSSFEEMMEWHRIGNGLPMVGRLIEWAA